MAALDPEEALRRVDAAVGGKITRARLSHGHVDIDCAPQNLVEVMTALRDVEFLSCKFFTFLAGVDRSELAENGGGLEVLVHVYSPEHVLHVNVRPPKGAVRQKSIRARVLSTCEAVVSRCFAIKLGVNRKMSECTVSFGASFGTTTRACPVAASSLATVPMVTEATGRSTWDTAGQATNRADWASSPSAACGSVNRSS